MRKFSDSRAQVEEELKWELVVNNAIAKLSDALINPSFSIEEIANIVLHHAKQLTRSEHGCVSSIDPDTSDNVGHTLTKMKGDQCRVTGKDKRIAFSRGPDGRYPSLWGHALNTHEGFYANSPETHEAYKGIPKGHIPLRNFLSVPAMVGEDVVGQIALANSDTDYTQQQLEAINRIGKLYVVAIQRKRIEEALQESEQKFRSLVETTSDWVWEVNQKGVYTYASPKVKDLLGYGPEEVIGKTPFDLMPPREAERVAGLFRNIVKSRRPFAGLENTNLHKNGKRVVLETSGVPILDLDGNLLGYRGIDRDITERKRGEEALQWAKRELTIRNRIVEIFLTIPDEEMFGEVLQIILETMESKYGIFGYIDEHGVLIIPSMTRDVWEECRVPDKTIVYPREKWGGIWGRALVEKRSLFANEGLHVPEGHVPVTRVLVVPVMYGGQVIGVLGVANKSTDYSHKDQEFLETIARKIAPILNARLQRDSQENERKEAEEALRKSEERYRTLYESSRDGITTANLKGFITQCNQAYANMLGYSREELKKIRYQDITPSSWHAFNEKIFQDVMERGYSDVFEKEYIRKDGTVFPVSLHAWRIDDEHGNPVGVGSIVRDITEHKHAEQERESLLHDMDERVKELSCMYGVAKSIRQRRTLEEIFQDVTTLISSSWHYPEITRGKVSFDEAEYVSEPFEETQWKQTSDIIVNGERRGFVGVYCLEEKPVLDEGPFLKEERNLIDGIARMLSDAIERKHAEENLREYQEHLEELVQTRTAELTEANKKLLEEIEQRKRLEKEILNISERERRRLGQELHDSLGQQLTGISFMAKVLEQKFASRLPDEASGAAEIAKLVSQATDQTRGLAKGLHPIDLDASSLMLSLKELAATTENLFGVRCTFKCDKPVEIDDTELAVHLYRITQEAITNAIRHSRAKNIQIGLSYGTDKPVLTVRSDGLGFPKSQAKSIGMGLQIMNHRAEIIGGTLDIRRGSKGGTLVICVFPNKKCQ